MSNIRIRDIEGYEAFKAECSFFKCEKEYPGWTGIERYGIVTDLSLEELRKKYPRLIENMSPVLLIPTAIQPIREENHRYESKYEMRAIRSESQFDFDEMTEICHDELINFDEEAHMTNRIALSQALERLTAIEKSRVIKKFYDGMSYVEISREEGVDPSSVRACVKSALIKMKKFL